MIRGAKLWLGLGLSVLLVGLFFLTVDIDRMVDSLTGASYPVLVPGVGLYLVSVLFRTLRWQVLLRHMRPVGLRRLYPVVVVGYMANNLLPMRLGELVRSYYVGEREGISKTSALATIFVERVLDALVLLFFIAAISLFIPISGLVDGLSDEFDIPRPVLLVATTVPFVAVFGLLVLSARFPSRSGAIILAIFGLLPERFRGPLAGMTAMFIDGLRPLRAPGTLALLFALSVPVWLFESGLFFLAGFSFHLDDAFDSLGAMATAAVLVTAVANIGSSIPAAPGGIGLFELVTRETLILLPTATIDRSVAAGYAAVVHFALLVPMILMGQAFLWAEHLSLRTLSRSVAPPSNTPASGARSPGEGSPSSPRPEGEEPA